MDDDVGRRVAFGEGGDLFGRGEVAGEMAVAAGFGGGDDLVGGGLGSNFSAEVSGAGDDESGLHC